MNFLHSFYLRNFFHIYKIKVLNSISIYDHLSKYDGIFNTIKAVNIYARFIYKMNVKKKLQFVCDSHWETWPGWLLSNQNCTCECESVCFIRWCWKDWRSDTYKNSIAIHMTICLLIYTKTDRNLSTPPIKCLNGECFFSLGALFINHTSDTASNRRVGY